MFSKNVFGALANNIEHVNKVIITFELQSRVVSQHSGERNFHSFYQLLYGCSEQRLRELGLSRDANHYHYLRQGNVQKVSDSVQHEYLHFVRCF